MKSIHPSKALVSSLALTAALALTAGCGQLGAADAGKGKDEGPKVVATIGTTSITRQDLEAEIIKQILDRQPDALDKVLAQKIDEKVLELEAAKAKLTRDQLLDREVKAKIAPLTQAEIDAFYEQNKARIPPNTPKEQVVPQIRQYLEQQRQQEAYNGYMTRLRSQYEVKNLLSEQREAELTAKAAEIRPQIEGSDAPSFGPANAKVTLVEFSDFQCPYCSRVVPTVEQVKQKYGDRVRFVFRQFPLNSIHPMAQKAAEAGLCAQEQGKFWELHNLMFAEQDKLEVDGLKDKAKRAGLDTDKFAACLDGNKMTTKVAESVALGNKVGVGSTPTLFLNGKPFPGGAPPFEQLSQEIDKELAKKS